VRPEPSRFGLFQLLGWAAVLIMIYLIVDSLIKSSVHS